MRISIGQVCVAAAVVSTGGGCTVTAYPAPARYQPPPPAYGYQPPPPAQPPMRYAAAAPPPGAEMLGPCVDPGAQDIPDLFDRPAKIAATGANATTIGCMARGDADLFLVDVPPGHGAQLVLFSVRGQRDMAPAVRVFNANRRDIEHLSVGPREELRGWAYVAGGTSFYVRVSQVYGVNEAYALTMRAAPVVEAGEPNDDAERATPLVPGRPISAFLAGPLNDPGAVEDWYRIDLPHDGDLVVDVDMSQGVSPILKLYDANRHEVTRQSAGPGERFQFRARVRRGVYHLRLASIYGLDAAGQNDPPVRLTRPYVISLAR